MGRSKIFIILILISFIVLFVFLKYDIIKEYVVAQSFDEIGLKYYDDTEFTDMNIYRQNGDLGRSDDTKNINKLLNYFKTLEYKRVSKGKRYSSWEDMIDISISTSDSGRLGIDIVSEKYIIIGLGYIIETEDKSKRLTKIKQNSEYKIYKVVDGKIDIDLIESIYDSMEIEKNN